MVQCPDPSFPGLPESFRHETNGGGEARCQDRGSRSAARCGHQGEGRVTKHVLYLLQLVMAVGDGLACWSSLLGKGGAGCVR